MHSFGIGSWKFYINIWQDIPWVDRWRPISRGALLSILADVAEDLKRFMWGQYLNINNRYYYKWKAQDWFYYFI